MAIVSATEEVLVFIFTSLRNERGKKKKFFFTTKKLLKRIRSKSPGKKFESEKKRIRRFAIVLGYYIIAYRFVRWQKKLAVSRFNKRVANNRVTFLRCRCSLKNVCRNAGESGGHARGLHSGCTSWRDGAPRV